MTASLAVEYDGQGRQWYIIWVFDGHDGATLGDSAYTAKDLATAKPEDWEHIAATIAAGQTGGVERRGYLGYRWDNETDAKKALRAVRAALKDKSKKPWPEWATKAVANGWKPPKGWKP